MMHLRLKAVVCTGLNVHTAKLEVCVCVAGVGGQLRF